MFGNESLNEMNLHRGSLFLAPNPGRPPPHVELEGRSRPVGSLAAEGCTPSGRSFRKAPILTPPRLTVRQIVTIREVPRDQGGWRPGLRCVERDWAGIGLGKVGWM